MRRITGIMKNKIFLILFTIFIFCIKTNFLFAQSEVNVAEKNRSIYNEGIDFYESGNEPFWNLSIAQNQYIRFSMSNGTEITSEYTMPEKAADAKVYQYIILRK